MTNVADVNPKKLIDALAIDLKENVKLKRPDWASNVKTGCHKERQPDFDSWWWMRAASVLRKVYFQGPVGVQKLRVVYGGKKNRGVKPEKFQRAGGKIIRAILQQLDEAGLTSKVVKQKGLAERSTGFQGRLVTPKGQSYLDKIASQIGND
ncbi:MAG: 30S ribosomal protein S19e [Candidatus Altiarchaeota archaeon]